MEIGGSGVGAACCARSGPFAGACFSGAACTRRPSSASAPDASRRTERCGPSTWMAFTCSARLLGSYSAPVTRTPPAESSSDPSRKSTSVTARSAASRPSSRFCQAACRRQDRFASFSCDSSPMRSRYGRSASGSMPSADSCASTTAGVADGLAEAVTLSARATPGASARTVRSAASSAWAGSTPRLWSAASSRTRARSVAGATASSWNSARHARRLSSLIHQAMGAFGAPAVLIGSAGAAAGGAPASSSPATRSLPSALRSARKVAPSTVTADSWADVFVSRSRPTVRPFSPSDSRPSATTSASLTVKLPARASGVSTRSRSRPLICAPMSRARGSMPTARR